ncbi:hypothetical protein ABMA27_000009 [Loxostege sticticalis]|uniref:RNA-directed DNA polymerase n=1 Tax=Loxostege sticticalis TaxID=481309 RepID=A0ABR3ILS3_LOXSC
MEFVDSDENRSRKSRSHYTPDVMESRRKRRREHGRSVDESIKGKRRRRHRRARSVSTESDERESRSKARTERKRSRKHSRRRKHEHRPSRSTERSRKDKQRLRCRRISSDRGGSSSGSTVSEEKSQSRNSNTSVFPNSETQFFLSELVKSLCNSKPEGNKFPMLGNVIPEFDPMVKGQTIHMWLNKVEECAKLYNWGNDQIIHYALPRLVGVARTWYQALPTMSFSWPEWKNKLIDSFPSSDDYAELLTEMLSKRVKFNESLELYYYEKINLLNRCEIFGKRAVDCLLYGIEDRSLRLGAKAAKCQEPEQVLSYFQSIKQQTRENDRTKVNGQDRRGQTNNQTNSNSRQFANSDGRLKSQTSTSVVCYNCSETGHFSFRCPKKILKCNVCNRLGHTTINCPQLPNESNKSNEKKSDKSVMQVDVDDSSNNKYFTSLKVNGNNTEGYIDLGSQCTLMQRNEAIRMGIIWSVGELPVMRGLGNNIVMPIGTANVEIEIHNITEKVDIYIVEDGIIKYPVLIGHSFTEKPGIVIIKTTDSLTFKRENPIKIHLFLKQEVQIQPYQMITIPVHSESNYSGPVYVRGSVRGLPKSEFYLLPGEYDLVNGMGVLLVHNFSNNILTLCKDSLITRVCCNVRSLDVNIIDFSDPNTDSELNFGEHLTETEITKLRDLLKSYECCFSSSLRDLGYTNVVQMEIQLTDNQPVVYRPYRLSYPERELVRSMVQEMMDADIVCESNSPYASPILLVKKKTGEKRLCVDYRALNNKTRKEHYPLPLIDDQLDRLSGNSLFISLDLASGYYQIPIANNSQHLTAFVTPDGQYQFKRMPFGLANAPSIFQRTMNRVLSRLRYVVIYMDDILIPACSFEEGITRLEEVFKLLAEAGLTLKLKKCYFFQTELDFLGFHVSGDGIRPGSRKTHAITDFPVPRNVHDVRRFIGLASFFRRFVKNFAMLACPLTNLLKSKFEWSWTDEHTKAFNLLKEKLAERPVLALFDASRTTELHTDASKIGVAGILMQCGEDGQFRPVAYYSRKTSEDEQKFHSFELETLAVIASLSRFRVYLLGLKFKIVTDCNALRTTLTKRDLIPRIARWWVQLQEYDCSIEYRAGARMAHVDALSRAPVAELTSRTDTHVIDVLQVEVKDWVATVQSNDEEIKRIRNILLDDETKFVADVRNNYLVKGEHVYRILDGGIRWVVPRSVRWQVLRMNHDDVGHFGFEKTLSRLKGTFWFPKMRRFTKKYVSACLQCAHHKAPSGQKEGYLHPIPKIEMPFHTLHADHLGPFVRSKKGNVYILAIVDSFTKFINIRAVKDTKTSSAIKIFKEYFSYFGTPSRLITDRGSCFTSAKFKEFTNKLNIKHILNAVATPRANGQVERFNRTILDALSTKCHGKNENTWDEYVGDIQLGINTTVNKSTGKSPSELLFGCKLVTTSENMLGDVITETSQLVSGNELMRLRSDAKDKMDKDQEVAKRRFDQNRKRARSYSVGDLVRIERTVIDKDHLGKSKKLVPKFQGPYRIVKVLPNDRFLVEDTPLTRKGNKRYENIVAIDKVHPWLNFNDYSTEASGSDSKCSDSDNEIDK